MTTQEQNKELANDILARNWYPYFKTNEKVIELVVGKSKYHISCCHQFTPFFKDIEVKYQPIEKIQEFYDWYIRNEYICDVILDGITTIEELDAYVDGAPPKIHFIIPLPLSMHDQVPSHQREDRAQCTYIFNYELGVDDEINWTKIHQPFNIYFSDGEQALNLLYQFQDLHIDLTTITWKFITPIDFSITNEMKVFHFFINYLDIMQSQHPDQFIDWLVSKSKPECPFSFKYNGTFHNQDRLQCGMQNHLTIDLSTMNLHLCPALCVYEYIIGEYDFTTSILEPNITELLIFKDHMRQSYSFGCETCNAKGLCNKYCLAQGYYETMVMGATGKHYSTHQHLVMLYQDILQYLQDRDTAEGTHYIDDLFSSFSDENYISYLHYFIEHGERPKCL